MCLSCEDIARQSYAMVPRWQFFASFLRPVVYCQRAVCSMFQTSILNSHKSHTMCGSTVDIQSATAEIRRGKRRKKKQYENIMPASATQGGHSDKTELRYR